MLRVGLRCQVLGSIGRGLSDGCGRGWRREYHDGRPKKTDLYVEEEEVNKNLQASLSEHEQRAEDTLRVMQGIGLVFLSSLTQKSRSPTSIGSTTGIPNVSYNPQLTLHQKTQTLPTDASVTPPETPLSPPIQSPIISTIQTNTTNVTPSFSSPATPVTETSEAVESVTDTDQRHDQKLHEAAQERKVPASRIERLFHFGGLAMGLGLGVVSEAIQRTVGFSEGGNSLLIMRGAALKVGQVLSIQDSALIPPVVQDAFERVRKGADYMTTKQLNKVLAQELGDDWREKFQEFEEKPFAAASIGQVHRAISLTGEDLAVKIQYPGVGDSIDSDIDNLATLLTVTGMVPKGLYIEKVLNSAKEELKLETDYLHEAECQKRFAGLVADDPAFYVPKIIPDLTTKRILTSELIYGYPIEELESQPQALRNAIANKLMELCLKELFLWRFMQTDPNWCNFFYDKSSNKINLLDFGASHEYSSEFTDEYLEIVYGAANKNKEAIIEASMKLGFLTGDELQVMLEAHTEAVMIIGEPFASDEPYDFHHQQMTKRIHELIPVMLKHRLKAPPQESYSLHRKLSGAFLLCTKLKAQISCRQLLLKIYDEVKKNKR